MNATESKPKLIQTWMGTRDSVDMLTSIMPYKSCSLTGMESAQDSGDHWNELKSNYAQNLAAGVDLPQWAAKSFSLVELAVLGAIRDAAYKAPNGACSLTVSEIARLAEVDLRSAIRAVTMAIAGGLIERDGGALFNRHIHYKVG